MNKKQIKLANNETYTYLEQGSGNKYLILIHGNVSSSVYFKPLLENLPKDIHVFAPDLRGFGDSSYNKRIDSLKDFALDIKLFMEELNIPKATVLGWSLGGGVVMELAAHYPELIEKLILLNSTTYKGYPVFKKDANNQVLFGKVYKTREEMAKDPLQVLPLLNAYETKNYEMLKYIYNLTIYTVNKPSEEDYLLYLDESMKQRNLVDVDFALASLNMGDTHNLYNEGENTIKNITCPILHLWGSQDKTVPEMMVLDNYNALKDLSTYIKFDNAGHSLLVDKPLELAEKVMDFIK